MALALYRTYRPGTLADVVGQEHVTEPLARALDADRTHHAYLFSGPRGCGKTSTARILARSLNCEQGPTSTPCGVCRSCVELAPNGPGSIDVVEMDAATHRGIDDARELREKAIYAPAASRFRVYIIDEAHQLTNEAANALLKLIEEPPVHLRFIFATTEPDKIIATIRSRTFHYPFRLVPARTLTEHLARVCQAEGVPAEPAALAVVARAGAGSVRDSLSVLGQLLAGAGPDGLTHADAVQALGLTDGALIDGFVDALSSGSVASMLRVVDGVISAGHDPRRFVSDVLDRLRDLIVLRADPRAVESGLIDVPDEAGQRLLAQSEILGLAELSRAADLVSVGLSEVKGATAPRLQLELLCARLALHHPGDDLSTVLARLERVERTVAAGVPPEASGGAPSGPPRQGGGAASEPAPPGSGAPASSPPAPPPPRPTLRSTRRAEASPGVGVSGAGQPAPEGRSAPAGSVAPEKPSRPGATSPGRNSADDRPAPGGSVPNDAAGATGRGQAGGPTQQQDQLERVSAAWASVLERLAQGSRVAWTVFAAARPLSLSDGTLAVAVAEPGIAANIRQRGHDVRLREALLDVLQLDVTIDVVYDGPTGAGSPGSQAPAGRSAAATSRAPVGPAEAAPSPAASASVGPAAAPASPASSLRAAMPTVAAVDDEPDVPSEDDPDVDEVDGLALVTRELGARTISEIDHA